jgi:hypothetical protein
MRLTSVLLCGLLATMASGCYRATIDTGLTPNGQTVEREWAHSFIGGLVPPSTVETASRCPNGAARIETQLSFLNMLAGGLTWGLYSPMTVKVQCAAAARDEDRQAAVLVPQGAAIEEATNLFNAAVARSRDSGEPVTVIFE